MDYHKSLQVLEDTIEELKQLNVSLPIIVEGEKDILALETLGIMGEKISINSGISIANLCDFIARKWDHVVILTDWDRHGGKLCRHITDNLQGRTKCNVDFRGIFAKNSTVKVIEGLPTYIMNLRKKIYSSV